jgi:hypothetical protein
VPVEWSGVRVRGRVTLTAAGTPASPVAISVAAAVTDAGSAVASASARRWSGIPLDVGWGDDGRERPARPADGCELVRLRDGQSNGPRSVVARLPQHAALGAQPRVQRAAHSVEQRDPGARFHADEVLDLIIQKAGRQGLKVILDNHSRKPDDFTAEGLWYLPDFPESRWITDWKTMAARHRDNPTVVAFDLHNEPYNPASWGGDPSTDWASAAERAAAAIHSVHPDAIIIGGGVQTYAGIAYWWGGNLRGVRDRPLEIEPSKLLYSAHDYGPEVFAQTWFSAPDFSAI